MLEGEMSGFNIEGHVTHQVTKNLNAMSSDKQQMQLATYCVDHPNDSFAKAVINLYAILPNAEGF